MIWVDPHHVERVCYHQSLYPAMLLVISNCHASSARSCSFRCANPFGSEVPVKQILCALSDGERLVLNSCTPMNNFTRECRSPLGFFPGQPAPRLYDEVGKCCERGNQRPQGPERSRDHAAGGGAPAIARPSAAHTGAARSRCEKRAGPGATTGHRGTKVPECWPRVGWQWVFPASSQYTESQDRHPASSPSAPIRDSKGGPEGCRSVWPRQARNEPHGIRLQPICCGTATTSEQYRSCWAQVR